MGNADIDTAAPPPRSTADIENGVGEKNIDALTKPEADPDNCHDAPSSVHESVASQFSNNEICFVKRIIRKALQKSHEDPLVDETPPDGGFKAWLIVFFAHQAGFNSFGFINAYGVLQSYYVSALELPPSTVSWIGSLCAFLMLFTGTFSGRLSDAGYFPQMLMMGTVIQIAGFLGASFSTKYWQILLAHGVCLGVGGGLVFVPAMSIAGTYFQKKRPLALAFCAMGNSIGGLVFAAILQQTIPKLGYEWAMRICGLLVMASSIPSNFVMRPMKLRRVKIPIIEWGAFREIEYSFLSTAMFLTYLGLWVPVFYLGSFGKNIIGISTEKAASLILIINGGGIAGRVLPALLASRLGPLNLMIPLTFLSGVILFCWASVHSYKDIIIFDVFYGFIMAAGQGMLPPSLGSMTKDRSKMGVRMGMVFTICGISLLIGQPLAGALIEANGGQYLYTQMYGGASMILGALFMFAARVRVAGWDLAVNV
ncbi:uncharacterized protein L3040_009243 [Drepanopeziza brunnea f. sp. 'multigermtubi']|uniref:MFS monocarboxylate transporter n=1 Tax=Marssonina brunnea f. sp. multigermtubi (strain MB_m1) TaxID=1072389 RepID=K1X268_MARBU|nr:MFS monocarboxylate transporter [Drepanopeziza brunnea f. sp. 'multigermtubi' MB_m1]EKD19316.1 MFS monocarboxylate transporter [Drepanopeziza brunnea f. sp. 'multigermtubi' MB_m1]KAJ5032647.1 hypothetical protein L3040_009243 [Drepanopeziza brunnea f. sp. 'multigermtubi']